MAEEAHSHLGGGGGGTGNKCNKVNMTFDVRVSGYKIGANGIQPTAEKRQCDRIQSQQMLLS